MISPQEALNRLREGNRRFVAGAPRLDPPMAQTKRAQLVAGQRPWAIVLGCSDSRVPVEMVFDQGPGDLFVVRVAGNVVAPTQMGSIELAAERFGTRLVVVLGHSRCGAVAATVDELRQPGGEISPGLQSILNLIRPSVEVLVAPGHEYNRDTLISDAVRANVRASVNRLRTGSGVLEGFIRSAGLVVVGAEYSLETGVVDFHDGPRDAG
jgi:carbonic anhydrase